MEKFTKIRGLEAVFTPEELAAIHHVAERLGVPWHEGLGLAWLVKSEPGPGPNARPFADRLGSVWRNAERRVAQDGVDLTALAMWEEARRASGGGLGDVADRAGLPELASTEELAQRLRVGRRRAQQVLRRACERLAMGDLWAGEGEVRHG